jgi:hypothetical protein
MATWMVFQKLMEREAELSLRRHTIKFFIFGLLVGITCSLLVANYSKLLQLFHFQ